MCTTKYWINTHWGLPLVSPECDWVSASSVATTAPRARSIRTPEAARFWSVISVPVLIEPDRLARSWCMVMFREVTVLSSMSPSLKTAFV